MAMEFEFDKIQTGISGAYWCVPSGNAGEPVYQFEAANLGREMTRADGAIQTSWFDELFDGGLVIPRKATHGTPNNVMTIMLSGPPGTGKSTLALELCYRLASNGLNRHSFQSVYLTTEGHPPWLIEHARNGFGWDPQRRILGEEDSKSPVDVRTFKTEADITRLNRPGEATFFQVFDKFLGSSVGQSPNFGHSGPGVDWDKRDIVVFDNLNTIDMPEKDWIQFLKDLGAKGPRIALIILDSSSGDQTAQKWEYLSDIVIHLGRDYPDNYMIRIIEIMKARYQHHVFGPQQLKILQHAPNRSPVPPREHPYRKEGGVFVYPSMHLVLARHNYVAGTKSHDFLPTPFEYLNELLGGEGFYSGRCVALTGHRGTHKSRLAYTQLLFTLVKDPKSKGVLISLGDDEETTKRILGDIASQFSYMGPTIVADLVREGRLEIAYYPPGLITPDEFFHRILLSVGRLRVGNSDSPILLIFSSLEILSSHFPLCAKHSIFIPALIELLGYRRVTSFFVATSDVHPDPHTQHEDENSGLLSMADPILRFERVPIVKTMNFPWLSDQAAAANLGLVPGESMVRMRIERFAAGTSAALTLTFCFCEKEQNWLGS